MEHLQHQSNHRSPLSPHFVAPAHPLQQGWGVTEEEVDSPTSLRFFGRVVPSLALARDREMLRKPRPEYRRDRTGFVAQKGTPPHGPSARCRGVGHEPD